MHIAPYDLDDAFVTQALKDGRARARCYVAPGPLVVLGRGSKPEIELNIAAIEADGVPVVRRAGGGCAVVLDPGNVIVSVVLPAAGLTETRLWFNTCTQWLIAALSACGIDGVTTDGVSDLVLGDRKIAGSCVHRMKGLVYFSASLLVTADVGPISLYLAHPPREPAYRNARPHADFVTTLASAGFVVTPGTLAPRLEAILTALAEQTFPVASGPA